MTDFSQLAADYLAGQAERNASADIEIAAMKALLLLHFKAHGDSGAIEQTTFFSPDGTVAECPDITVAREGRDEVKLASLLEDFAYEVLERHHDGWEINDGGFGELLIDVGEESFQLDCNLRFTSYNSHSTEF